MIREIFHKKKLLATVIINKNIKKNFDKKKGINFFTDIKLPLQIGSICYPLNHIIKPHFHKKILFKTLKKIEILFILDGKIRADFYTFKNQYFKSYIFSKGDILILYGHGHGFKVLSKNLKIYELKLGKYSSKIDKVEIKNNIKNIKYLKFDR